MAMDEAVLRAMARWPDVPAVHGWLSLDRRGRWRLRGGLIGNRAACEFIGRNYLADERGRWYFQNGPQRVYVALDYTPWVLRLRVDGSLETHTGTAVHAPRAAFVDEKGSVLVAFEEGVGLLEDRDLGRISEALCDACGELLAAQQALDALEALTRGEARRGVCVDIGGHRLALASVRSEQVAARFGFDPEPADAQKS